MAVMSGQMMVARMVVVMADHWADEKAGQLVCSSAVPWAVWTAARLVVDLAGLMVVGLVANLDHHLADCWVAQTVDVKDAQKAASWADKWDSSRAVH